jgi:hypothetical protein
MKYNAIIFTDISDYFIPIRTHGAYSIAAHLRDHGYTVKVIDHQSWLWENHGKELISLVESMIGPETIFVGFSSTFSRYFGEPYYNSPRKIKKGLKKKDCFPYLRKLICLLKSKYPHVKLVLGGQGLQTLTFYQEYKDELDCWVRGLGEDSIIKFVCNIEDGVENPKIIEDASSSKFDFHNQKNVFTHEDNILDYEVLPLAISRGCRFKCKFCTYPLLGRKPSEDYIRNEDSVYSELMHNYENFSTTSYMFTDDTFNETTDKIERVLRAVKRTGVDMNFWAYIRIELLYKFPEQIELLRDLGLKACFFGIESLYDPSAKAIGKGLGRDKVLDTLQRAKTAWGESSSLHGSFIIGLPHETKDTADEWSEMLINGETALDTISCNRLFLVPQSTITSKNTSKVFFSEFELNKSKYGYTETPEGGWDNEHWKYQEALDYAENVMKRFVDARPEFTFKRSAQSTMAIMNLKVNNPDLNWEDVHDISPDQLDNIIDHTKEEILMKYKEKLFNGKCETTLPVRI